MIDWFKQNHQPEEGYQTSINRALREYIRQQHTVDSSPSSTFETDVL